MNLADLFLPGSPYRKVLSARIAGGGHSILKSFSNWYLDEQGIWFAFVDGDAVDSDCEFVIPYAELRAVIDPAGPAGSSWRGPSSGRDPLDRGGQLEVLVGAGAVADFCGRVAPCDA